MPKGQHFEGKKLGNNYALKGSKKAKPGAISEGKLKANKLIRDIKAVLNLSQEMESMKLLANGEETPLSMDAHAAWVQLQKAIKGDTQAYKAWVETTRGTRQNHVMQDNEGNNTTPNILVQMIKRGVKLT